MQLRRRQITGALVIVPFWSWAFAEDAKGYPNKSIRLVLPAPPGGGGDTLARLVCARLSQELGQAIVIDNVAGGGGNIGTVKVARALNDGYTLLYGYNGTFGINPTLYKNPGYDPLKDFEPISRMTRIATLLAVRRDLPANTMGELLSLIRANPGKYTFGSAGSGTTSHLAGEILKSQARLDILHVPYKGGAAAMVDLLGGRIDFMLDVAPNITAQMLAGKVRVLAVGTAQRSDSFPNIPTIAESGLPDFDVSAWDALFAPANTPLAIVDRLNAAVRVVLAEPEMRKALLARASDPAPTSPEELRQLVKTEIPRWASAIRSSGASVD